MGRRFSSRVVGIACARWRCDMAALCHKWPRRAPGIIGGQQETHPMIAIHAGNSVPEYDQAWPKVEVDRPAACPLCHTAGQMIVHGRYPRQKPLEAAPEAPHPVKVRRWFCKACKRTTSMLPDIFHRYRQYTWAVIGAVLIPRFVLRQTS